MLPTLNGFTNTQLAHNLEIFQRHIFIILAINIFIISPSPNRSPTLFHNYQPQITFMPNNGRIPKMQEGQCLIKYINYMKKVMIILALLMICSLADRRIVSRPITSTYNQYGRVSSLIIEWKCYQPIYQTDILKITLPETIHNTSLTIGFSLFTAHSLSIVASDNSLTYVGSNAYFLPVKVNLAADVWYQLQLNLDKSLTVLYGLVQMEVVSSTSLPTVSYAWNNGFEYYHLEQSNIPRLNILSLNVNNSLSRTAGQRYLMLIQIASTILIDEPVNVTFQFADFNSSNLSVNTAVSGADKGFIFTGSCYARCDYGDLYHVCIQNDRCQLNSKSVTITLPYMKPNELYLIETYVVNPPYVSSVGLEAYWKDNSGRTTALAFADDTLFVAPVIVQPEQIRLLWDIPYSTVVNEMKLGLIVNNPAVKHQSLSSFDIGFSVSDVTPIEGQYEVKITVGATSVLESSINHNLPSLKSTTKISCRYAFPTIICIGVDAFVKPNFRYFVRARGYFTTSDILTQFGNVGITAISQPNNLFTNLVRGLAVTTILNSDYHDYGGLHEGTSNYRIAETIVTSHKDTMLPNSTTKSIEDFLYSTNSLVGVDPSISPQQLLFFMKVNTNQMSRPSPASFGQNYTMKIFTNPNIMNVSNLGIDFLAYSATTRAWDVAETACYVDSSTTPTTQKYMCQKYNDHVYNRQIDNTFIKTNNYGLFTWTCGSGQVVTCPIADCSSYCQVLRGGFSNVNMTTGSAGVLSIRNVTFIDSYHSPVEAGRYNFDFVIAFYHDGLLISSSLINAYTLNRTRLENVRADVINHYHDTVLTNQGNRLPTLLKISGHLTLQEAGRKLIKSIRVYFPSILAISNFVQTTNFNKYGCSTQNCTASTGGLTKPQDCWVTQNSIEISTLPSLTQRFNFIFPVVYSSPSQLLQITLSFVQFDGKIGGVFRINGSASTQSLVGNANYTTAPWTPVNSWLTTLTQWVNQPTLHSFKQSIDLSAIVPFAPSNTINMGTTVMPSVDVSPSTTFSSAYVNIFSNYSYPKVDGAVSCIDPFGYTYLNSYQVWTLWCPVQVGSLNQIKFNFPLYPDSFGSNFPYSMVFAYGYANTAGQLIGFRKEPSLSGTAQTCSTQKTTTYDKNSVNPQQNEFLTTLGPIKLTPATRNKFMVALTIPSTIPVTLISCRAQQPNQNVNFACSILPQASNLLKMELTYQGTTPLSVYAIRLMIKTVKSAVSTITTIPLFYMNVSMPFTDSTTNQASFTGTLYAPFSSLIASCANPFTYSSVNSQQFIYLSSPKLNAVSSSYYSTLQFRAAFSNSRTTLFDTSILVITFSEPVLTPYSRCELSPNTHFFVTSSVDTTNKIMSLTPQRNIQDFTLVPYLINCYKIITNGNNITVSMMWKDGAYNLQTNLAPIVVPHTNVNSAVTAATGLLTNKFYNSPGHLGEYHITISVATTATDKIVLYVDFGLNHVNEMLVYCQYLAGTLWTQAMCLSNSADVQSEVYLEYVASAGTNIQVKIYGVHQTKASPSTIKVLTKKVSLTTGTTTHYITNIADIATIDIVNAPIEINSFMVDSNSTLTMTYVMPTAYSSLFFIRFDELFRMFNSDVTICTINTTTVPCQPYRPDLLLVSNALLHSVSSINTIKVSRLNYFYQEKYDAEEVHFSMFITNSAKTQVMYGSHQHLQDELLASELMPPESLIWRIPPNQYNSVCQVVYIGYYGPPANLIVSTKLPFKQSFNYNSTNSPTLVIKDLMAQLGTDFQVTDIGTFDSTQLGFKNLIFTHTSSYVSISSLPVYVSADKCTLHAEFNDYNIISGGVTIPIAINMSKCRPMNDMTVETAVNSPYISADVGLSTKIVSQTTEMLYIVLMHQSVTTTVGQSFQLKISLTCSNLIVQNAYNTIPNVTIHVVDRSLLIGNPEAKQPIINSLSQTSIELNLQCNTPATIYWGVGLYPTMLGITVQEIQARLIELNNGLAQKTIDIYSWSHQLYGLNYVNDFNIEKNLTVNGLEGGLSYVFKYFCIDQTGKASGGKITRFYTLASNYSLMKVSLSFPNVLTYLQVNTVACAISEQLMIPYNETISSIHSNCINNSQIYYKNTSSFYDQKSGNAKTPYSYFFYVNTNKMSIRNITTRLVTGLGQNAAFMNSVVPYYGSMRADSLYNSYEPVIYDMWLSIRRTEFTINVNVGLANTYLIAAIMDQHFNPITMSLPTHYIMKEGYFSLGTKFEQIFSIYGRQNISVTFKNLSEGQKLSVFYFVTVDNSALNARNSKVLYQDLVTNTNQIIDLNEFWVIRIALTLCALVFLL